MAKGLSRFADFISQNWSERSWTDCLEAGEALGGPSAMGSSKWQDFKDCPYLYSFKHVQRFRKREWDTALEVGGLFHEALARYFASWLAGEPSAMGKERAFEIVNRCYDHVPDISSEVNRLLTFWMGMFHETPYSFRERVLAAELLVEGPVEPWGFRYTARLDLILEAEDGGIELMDHKTSKNYHANTLMSYRMEPQFLGHMHLWEASGLAKKWGPCTKFTVDLITKTNSPTMELVNVVVDQTLINQWRAEMREHWVLFRRYQRGMRRWPRRTGYQCRFCDAFEHCAMAGRSLNGWIRKQPTDY